MSDTIDFGIDLGTTNSSIAVCRRGEVRVFQTNELMNVTPSVVYVSKAGRMLVGRKAYDNWAADPQNAQAEFKRWMGYSDKLKFPASGRELSAEDLSAEVLKSLRADAERQMQEKLSAAVITVPAAFGSLQCEATERAARLAGFEQAPLLQEPIAAAIACGASPAARNQRWMVFDLGGGTLDIAIVSTRNDRLAVLEHQGNNRLGGKDIDRALATELLLPPLAATYRLPDPAADPQGHRRLLRLLTRHAEQAKIALSAAPDTTVELFDLGDDLDGKAMELVLPLTREQLNSRIAPIVEQCLDLARRALAGARLEASELDRLLLVGGPTQMPAIREALHSALGVKLDHSLDPMTVVSHGAALYASTLEKTAAGPAGASAGASAAAPPRGTVPVQLAYERASGSARSPVGGVIQDASVHEIKIDAAGGVWTSGWVPVVSGAFQVTAVLDDHKPLTRFALSARDRKGNVLPTSPAEFSITFMLPMSAPPLPHTIAVEISSMQGIGSFDPIFARHTPLPAEARRTYKAERTLRPSEIGATLPIKFWEIEVSDDPQEKWWAGCVHLRAEQIKRPVVEGSEIELTVKIDASRRLSVELFVPLLNAAFTDDVFVPDPPTSRSQMQQQLDLCFERLNFIREEVYASDHGDLAPRVMALQERAEQIAEQTAVERRSESADPDAALAPTEALRKLRLQLSQIEEILGIGDAGPTVARRLRNDVNYLERTIDRCGTEREKEQGARLLDQYRRYVEADDTRGLQWVHEQLWRIHFQLMENAKWYWEDRFDDLKSPRHRFVNQTQAEQNLQTGEAARARDDLPALRTAVRSLWALLPADKLKAAKEQAAHSGLRGV